MRTIQALLKDADPVAHEPRLPAEEVERMRRLVLDAADAPRGPSAIWRQSAWVVVVAAVLLAVVFSARPTPAPRPSGGTLAANSETSDAAVHQLQFSTPGGTRVIWFFNAEVPGLDR